MVHLPAPPGWHGGAVLEQYPVSGWGCSHEGTEAVGNMFQISNQVTRSS